MPGDFEPFNVPPNLAQPAQQEWNCTWPNGPHKPVLPAGQVQVWAAPLDLNTPLVKELQGYLDEQEMERARSFRFERDQRRFVTRRGLLRLLLGRYLDLKPQQVRFQYSSYGKPALANELDSTLQFNLSRSNVAVLFALTRNRAVGVDIEQIHPDLDYMSLAERFFSPIERAALRSLPPDQSLPAFFTCWTRKEAYIKAHGLGLSLPLDQFDVSVAPDEVARLLATRHGLDRPERWELYHLDPLVGYAAALCVERASISSEQRLEVYRWQLNL